MFEQTASFFFFFFSPLPPKKKQQQKNNQAGEERDESVLPHESWSNIITIVTAHNKNILEHS